MYHITSQTHINKITKDIDGNDDSKDGDGQRR